MKNIIFTIIILTVFACNDDNNYEFTYDTIVADEPINLEEINSVFDDYNSALPYPAFRNGIYFSTNRHSGGDNFDIIYREMDISYHSRDDALNITHVSAQNTFDNLEFVLDEINTDFDEFGPYPYWGNGNHEFFLYANNDSTDFDIKYVSIRKGDTDNYTAPASITSLNSDSDDLYPSISDDGIIFFCSDRENDSFNIYSSIFNESEIDPDLLQFNVNSIELNDILSSNGNDKCPYVFEDMIVFTSDREGGFGGYDLYYSQNIGGVWSEPKNMGEKINSSADEYRPIIIPFFEFEEKMLIFSSDREGGRGGFDLYAVRAAL